MKRLVSILLAVVLVFGMASSAMASDEKDLAENILNYSVGMLKMYKMMYETFGDMMGDTYIRNAYAYLMMAYGAYAVKTAELADALKASAIKVNEETYKLCGDTDILIIAMHDVVSRADQAYADYYGGKITREEFLKTLMERVDRVISMIDSANQYMEEYKNGGN